MTKFDLLSFKEYPNVYNEMILKQENKKYIVDCLNKLLKHGAFQTIMFEGDCSKNKFYYWDKLLK